MKEDRKLRLIDKQDLDLLLEWRNSVQVRQFMYSTHEINRDEHFRWYESVRSADDRYPRIFTLAGKPVGFVNIGPVRAGGVADWGFYTAPDAPRGTGRKMGECALDFAFSELQLHKICGEALSANEASRNYHRRLGFRQEGELKDNHFDGSNYHNVICFGLTINEWRKLRAEVGNDENT